MNCEFNKKVREYKIKLITEMLERCPQDAQNRFNKYCNGDASKLPDDQFKSAYYLLKRTLEKSNMKCPLIGELCDRYEDQVGELTCEDCKY